MTKDEQLRRCIIELIHGTSYEEAWTKELNTPITLARVLQSLQVEYGKLEVCGETLYIGIRYKVWKIFKWLLTNPDGSECTLDEQSEETKEALYQLLIIK